MAAIGKLFSGPKKPTVEPVTPAADTSAIERTAKRRAAIARQASSVAATKTSQAGQRETLG